MKKNRTPKNFLRPSDIERYSAGSGLTKEYRLRIRPTTDNISEVRELFQRDFSYSGSIAIFEKWAIQTLDIPRDPNVLYGIPDGKPAGDFLERSPKRKGVGTLNELVKARGYKERDAKEWYAAEILARAARVQKILSRTKADPESGRHEVDALASFAFDLGLLVYEAIGFKFPYEAETVLGHAVWEGARKGGRTKKRLPPVATLVRSLIRENRRGTAAELWQLIPTDQVDGIKVSGHKFYRAGEQLVGLAKVEGSKDWRPVGRALSFAAFRKRVGIGRSPTAR